MDAGNPCISEETFTLVDDGEGALSVGYCPEFSACGTVGPECVALEFVREADETYTVYGLNFNLSNQSHGVPAAQTISAWGELPADTRITMDVRISMPPPGSPDRVGDLALTFSGTEVTIHTFNDPWLE